MPGPRDLSVVIVGAGFGGIAAAIELRRHGFRDVTILDRAAELGGTWYSFAQRLTAAMGISP